MSEVQELRQEFLENVKLFDMKEEEKTQERKEQPHSTTTFYDMANRDERIAHGESFGNIQENAPEKTDEKQFMTEKLDELEQTVLSLNTTIQKIAGSSEAAARQLNQVNENLHRENQRLKEGLYESLLLPVLKDFISLGNDILMDISRCRKNGEEQIAKGLESALNDIHTVLEKYDIEVYQPQEGGLYEPIMQKIVRTVDTDEEERDRTIAEVRSFGYRMVKSGTSVVLAPCKVYVYKLIKEKEPV